MRPVPPLFRRRTPAPVAPSATGYLDLPPDGAQHDPDPWLPPLSRGEALAVRVLVTSRLRSLGQDTAQHAPDAVTTRAGATVDLRAVVGAVHALPPAARVDVVERLVTAAVAGFATDGQHVPAAPASPLAAVERRLVAGVVRAGVLAPAAGPAMGPHLQACALLVVDGEARVVTDLGPHGGWDGVHAEAVAGVRLLDPPQHHVVGYRGGADVHVLTTADPLAPSRLHVLDDLLDRLPHAAAGGRALGTLVAVPHGHALAVHVVTGGGILAAARGMLDWAARARPDGLVPTSPHVHHRGPDGALRAVTEVGPTGAPRLRHDVLADLVAGAQEH